MKKYFLLLSIITLVIGLPIFFKQSNQQLNKKADDTLIIITPHNESIRSEVEMGFCKWYSEKTGRTVSIDWRIPGSTGEIIRYVDSVFINSFRLHWERDLHQVWNQTVQTDFSNISLKASDNEARKAFLTSHVGCGIDILFGGGVIEHKHAAEVGQLISSGVVESHPDWFCDDVIPYKLAGDYLWDKEGRWIGSSLSSFGIIYNVDRIQDLNMGKAPTQWMDLTSPKFFRQIAMVDPVQSSVVIKCFEMMFQQQMRMVCDRYLSSLQQSQLTAEQERAALNEGWMKGLKMMQKIMANSRYFTDNSVSTVWDVSIGNCAAGVVVDFYGRYQKDILRVRCNSNRVEFVMPKRGSSVSPDPISMFRGAPHPNVAARFIEYIVSEEGQNLSGFKVGVPGGPQYVPLGRTPIRKDFYVEEKKSRMLADDLNPFANPADFEYCAAWTATCFQSIRFLSKVLFMDTYTELSRALEAIILAREKGHEREADEALAILEDLDDISYDWMCNTLRPLLRSKKPLLEIQLSTELTDKFCKQYLKAYKIAKQVL